MPSNISSYEVSNVGLHMYFVNILRAMFLAVLYLPTPYTYVFTTATKIKYYYGKKTLE